jgi:hypothetical protein
MVLRAGKSFDVDSEDERLLPGEGSSGSKHKKHKTLLQSNLGRPPLTAVVHSDTPALVYGGPWMHSPQPWMQPSQLAYSNPWMMAGQSGGMMGGQSGGMTYGIPWMFMPHTADTEARQDNAAHAIYRQKWKDYDAAAASRTTGGQKPHTLRVKDGGDIDGGCTGKNAWDDAVRSLVPWILDISVVEWEAQKSAAVEKLRNALDADFEYEIAPPNHLSEHCP